MATLDAPHDTETSVTVVETAVVTVIVLDTVWLFMAEKMTSV
jgi:hypothetical protein